jgi:hypothetical protein
VCVSLALVLDVHGSYPEWVCSCHSGVCDDQVGGVFPASHIPQLEDSHNENLAVTLLTSTVEAQRTCLEHLVHAWF